MPDLTLRDRRIALPESRELDLFSRLLEKLGAQVVRCPMVRVRPLDRTEDLDRWLRGLAGQGHDALVFYTGVGVSHIVEGAGRLGLREEVLAALGRAKRYVRGPKPIAALRKLGLEVDAAAPEPTTQGLLALLASLPLRGLRVGVQLYPGFDDAPLRRQLEDAGAIYDPVTPYAYASDEEDGRVAALIAEMADGKVDLIAFTSTPQVARMTQVAARAGLAEALARGLAATKVAAVGPVTAQALAEAGIKVDMQPAANFHLKPLVAEIARRLGAPGR
jgi:uroporphyrinogen-III synthase